MLKRGSNGSSAAGCAFGMPVDAAAAMMAAVGQNIAPFARKELARARSLFPLEYPSAFTIRGSLLILRELSSLDPEWSR